MTPTTGTGDGMPGAPHAPLRGAEGYGFASPVISYAEPLGVAAARKARRRSKRPTRRVLGGAQTAGVVGLAAGVLAVSATRIGAVDGAVGPLSFQPPEALDLAPGPFPRDTAPDAVGDMVEWSAPTVEPTLEFAGRRWQLVWALVPNDPAESAGLWPGTPWPGNPGRSLIGVQEDLSATRAGDAFAVDGRVWTVFEVRQVAPDDWESLAEQPVQAAEVAVYELHDTDGRARVAVLARGSR